MTYQPVLPTGGLLGWRFLERTYGDQRAAYEASGAVERATDYFREKIGQITTAEELVADRRLLETALAAFGLSEDVNSKFFIRKVLADGTSDQDALANRLADRRYREFSRAFGFGEPGGPNTTVPGFADRITARFAERSFETAVGETSNSLRLALNARRELQAIAEGSGSETAKWFTVLGTPPVREVIEGALGLPKGIGALDLDRQLDEFQRRAEATFGTSTISGLAEEETLSRAIDLYLVRAGNDQGGPTSPALVLLRGF
ncbi:DUF1217 domain-containing protein [Jannaschia aquimarina]|uniref:Flagellar protein n=1 Tax=Jannaschia aquimarina TaxID=935700 RepID=A0A0D1D5S6_9RHOB|nr:DUF1217 domain-containing protein [Jannaschia aquimarina]KIT15298.1 hypothetical protein jaqu_29130 [Jannaschia aquimarina]SNS50689.1 Protein of unknown function [Jannaschia aquimarina]